MVNLIVVADASVSLVGCAIVSRNDGSNRLIAAWQGITVATISASLTLFLGGYRSPCRCPTHSLRGPWRTKHTRAKSLDIRLTFPSPKQSAIDSGDMVPNVLIKGIACVQCPKEVNSRVHFTMSFSPWNSPY